MENDRRIIIDSETSLPWVEVAQGVRLYSYVLDQVGDPLPGSPFAFVNEGYPFEKASDWCRGFLRAGVEHLMMWADFVAPLKFHPDAVVTHTFRPAQTLSRAALESSSQAVWVMATRDPKELLKRHLRLIAHDFEEQAKAAPDEEARAAVKDRATLMWERLQPYTNPSELGKFRGYMTTVLSAVQETAAKSSLDPEYSDPRYVERLWRASAGSAHGKRWPSLELQEVVVGEEYEPGQHRTTLVPDPAAITKILQLANAVLQYGIFRFADYSGYEPQLTEMLANSRRRLAKQIPLKPGAVMPEEFLK